MARNNEPAFRRKTPLLICSIRTEIPYPCIGSSANVFRMSISSVPWTRSLGLSAIKTLPLDYQEEHTLLPLVVKRSDTVVKTSQNRNNFRLAARNLRRVRIIEQTLRTGVLDLFAKRLPSVEQSAPCPARTANVMRALYWVSF